MDSRVKSVNRIVRGYDKYLFAQREQNGNVHIYRLTSDPANPMYFVCALTDNWLATGRNREWGLEVIRARLKAMDIWADESPLDRLEKEHERREESDKRSFGNNVEAFMYDFRRQFARATNEVNTGSLSKFDRRSLKGA